IIQNCALRACPDRERAAVNAEPCFSADNRGSLVRDCPRGRLHNLERMRKSSAAISTLAMYLLGQSTVAQSRDRRRDRALARKATTGHARQIVAGYGVYLTPCRSAAPVRPSRTWNTPSAASTRPIAHQWERKALANVASRS